MLIAKYTRTNYGKVVANTFTYIILILIIVANIIIYDNLQDDEIISKMRGDKLNNTLISSRIIH